MGYMNDTTHDTTSVGKQVISISVGNRLMASETLYRTNLPHNSCTRRIRNIETNQSCYERSVSSGHRPVEGIADSYAFCPRIWLSSVEVQAFHYDLTHPINRRQAYSAKDQVRW